MGREGLLIGSLGGVIALATLTLMLGAAVGGVLYEPEIAALLRRLARRVVPPPEPPEGQPIERIARDARRLRGAVLACTPGTPMARRVAAVQAYDDRLVEACRALGVPDSLTGLPPGARRDAERLHVEYLLGEAGLNLGT